MAVRGVRVGSLLMAHPTQVLRTNTVGFRHGRHDLLEARSIAFVVAVLLAISVQDEEVAHKLPEEDNGRPTNIRQQKIGLFG